MIKNKEERRFYNYIYLDPTKPVNFKIKGLDIILKYEPFYVGKGTGNRSIQHITYNYLSSGFMKNKMNNFKKNNITPIVIKVINNISNYEACENEKYLIKSIGRRNLNKGTLCNLTDGGDGFVGYKRSKKTISKIIATRTNRKRTPQELIHLAVLHKNSRENKENIDYAVKSVYQINKYTNIIIKEFKSLVLAEKELKIQRSNIYSCCRGERKTAGGFKWKFK